MLAATPQPSLAQNLVVNPGFETGDFTGWTLSGNSADVQVQNINAHSGTYAAWLGSVGSDGFLTQSISVTRAGNYQFSFWLSNQGGTPSNFSASLGGNVFLSQTNPSASAYVQYVYTVSLAAGSTTLQFAERNDPAYFILDDISLMLLGATALTPTLPSNATINQFNLAGAIDNFTNSGGTLPAALQNLYNLSPAQLQSALNQLDGEVAIGGQQASFVLMTQFLDLMLDQSGIGLGDELGGANPGISVGSAGTPADTTGYEEGTPETEGALGFAPDRQSAVPLDITGTYNAVLNPQRQPSADRRWTSWASGLGGGATFDGNATVGSTNLTATTYGYAAGMRYRVTSDTTFGFALAGGGFNWGLAQGLGGGRAEAAQTGLYAKSLFGPTYIAAALAFANNWTTMTRSALGTDLAARVMGQTYGARLEAGRRFVMPTAGIVFGVTPYAALQEQFFHTPAYTESDPTGSGLGLTYSAANVADTRTELGERLDVTRWLGSIPVLLTARFAWLHDWETKRSLDALFTTLPGTSFVVNGASPPENSALVSLGSELKLTPQLSLLGRFYGEFATTAQMYAGTGTIRYQW